ncbi:hypothetical protein ACFFX0_05130 [Citricoccus parietis]|uniref:Uncharacterized protein n=1 Tax=Citricoccus parietis TaxID=592307 RepID=A0ABV5FV98_9MICC
MDLETRVLFPECCADPVDHPGGDEVLGALEQHHRGRAHGAPVCPGTRGSSASTRCGHGCHPIRPRPPAGCRRPRVLWHR